MLGGKPWGKRQLGRPRYRWEDNIKMDFSGSEMSMGMEWVDLTQDKGQVAGCCECGNEPSGFYKMRQIS